MPEVATVSARAIPNFEVSELLDSVLCVALRNVIGPLPYGFGRFWGTDLSLVLGDWNYVAAPCARVSRDSGVWSGQADVPEEREFQRTVASPCQLVELLQPEHTFDGGMARSRLDRVYSTHDPIDQLDRAWAITALPWCRDELSQTDVSDHRPLSFSRRLPRHKSGIVRPINAAAIRDPRWLELVGLRLAELEARDLDGVSPLRRLQLAKKAMVEVGEEWVRERKIEQERTLEDESG